MFCWTSSVLRCMEADIFRLVHLKLLFDLLVLGNCALFCVVLVLASGLDDVFFSLFLMVRNFVGGNEILSVHTSCTGVDGLGLDDMCSCNQ